MNPSKTQIQNNTKSLDHETFIKNFEFAKYKVNINLRVVDLEQKWESADFDRYQVLVK